jgi:hypothetical protein
LENLNFEMAERQKLDKEKAKDESKADTAPVEAQVQQ